MLQEVLAVLQDRRAEETRRSPRHECIIIKPNSKERCQEVEEKECIKVEHADQSGTITCLVSIQPPTSSYRISTSLSKLMKFSGIVGGTSRGWILYWNSNVIPFYNPPPIHQLTFSSSLGKTGVFLSRTFRGRDDNMHVVCFSGTRIVVSKF